jgi:hypothetical protein
MPNERHRIEDRNASLDGRRKVIRLEHIALREDMWRRGEGVKRLIVTSKCCERSARKHLKKMASLLRQDDFVGENGGRERTSFPRGIRLARFYVPHVITIPLDYERTNEVRTKSFAFGSADSDISYARNVITSERFPEHTPGRAFPIFRKRVL